MFRRQENTLAADPRYPADLEKLGYFIDNSTHACIRNIKAPELFFDFYYTNEDRHNEVRGEAMRICQREEVIKRLSALGLERLYLPTLANTKPDGPHIPILAPPAEVLKTRKRVIVFINDDSFQDLGVLAYRELQRDLGLNGGSIVNFAKSIIARSNSDADSKEELFKDGAGVETKNQIPGLILMNNAQLLYSHKFNQALSIRGWVALPRKSITHDPVSVHPVENRVEGHRTPEEHIKSVFDTVINNPDFVSPEAEVYVIAVENGIEKLFGFLKNDVEKRANRITAMALIHPLVYNAEITNPLLKQLLHTRARQWKNGDGSCTDPTMCTSLPSDYKSSRISSSAETEQKLVNWFEALSSPRRELSDVEIADGQADTSFNRQVKTQEPKVEQGSDHAKSFPEDDPICPTFPGGDTWVGECVFTQPAIQQAILSFFEEVAQNPVNFRNPNFEPSKSNIPEPTPDNPLVLSSDGVSTRELDAIPNEEVPAAPARSMPEEMLSPEAHALNDAKTGLEQMKIAFAATPADNTTLALSRQSLEKRIARKELEIEEMEKKALATGGLGAGAAQELREGWQNMRTGEKWVPEETGAAVPFAGTMADSEAMKRAGLSDTVEEELEKLELEGK